MKPLFYIPLLSIALALGACDKAESERKAALEKKADAMDKSADVAKDAAESKAHEDKAAGEKQADAIKKEADAVREQK